MKANRESARMMLASNYSEVCAGELANNLVAVFNFDDIVIFRKGLCEGLKVSK